MEPISTCQIIVSSNRSKRLKTVSCQYCQIKSVNKRNLKRHQRIHSNPLICDICNHKFGQKGILIKHKERVHSIVKPAVFTNNIEIINKVSISKDDNITKDYLFLCIYCNLRFKYCSYLRSHELTHIIKEPYSCDICSTKFVSNLELLTHSEDHTSEIIGASTDTIKLIKNSYIISEDSSKNLFPLFERMQVENYNN